MTTMKNQIQNNATHLSHLIFLMISMSCILKAIAGEVVKSEIVVWRERSEIRESLIKVVAQRSLGDINAKTMAYLEFIIRDLKSGEALYSWGAKAGFGFGWVKGGDVLSEALCLIPEEKFEAIISYLDYQESIWPKFREKQMEDLILEFTTDNGCVFSLTHHRKGAAKSFIGNKQYPQALPIGNLDILRIIKKQLRNAFSTLKGLKDRVEAYDGPKKSSTDTP